MNIGFRLYFNNGDVLYLSQKSLIPDADGNYSGTLRGITYHWNFEKAEYGTFVELSVESEKPLNIRRMDSVVFGIGKLHGSVRFCFYTNHSYRGETRFPDEVGIDREYCGDAIGVYEDFCTPGVTLAGVVPFKNMFGAGEVTRITGDVELFAKTEYTVAMSKDRYLCAEKVLLCESVNTEQFYQIYRELLPQSHFAMPKLTGWNTWDYYLKMWKHWRKCLLRMHLTI